VHTLGIYHWKALCAMLFVSPKKNLNLVVQRLDSQAKGDHKGLFLNQLELNILAGGVTARVTACSLSRRCSSPAGGNLKRSELGREGFNFARASCASGPWVKRPCQEHPADCHSWAWPVWRTAVATSLRPIPNTTLKKTLKDSNWSD
jgi:hypothetical protein